MKFNSICHASCVIIHEQVRVQSYLIRMIIQARLKSYNFVNSSYFHCQADSFVLKLSMLCKRPVLEDNTITLTGIARLDVNNPWTAAWTYSNFNRAALPGFVNFELCIQSVRRHMRNEGPAKAGRVEGLGLGCLNGIKIA